MGKWLIIIILILIIAGLWFFPQITKSLVAGAVGTAKSITGYVVGLVK